MSGPSFGARRRWPGESCAIRVRYAYRNGNHFTSWQWRGEKSPRSVYMLVMVGRPPWGWARVRALWRLMAGLPGMLVSAVVIQGRFIPSMGEVRGGYRFGCFGVRCRRGFETIASLVGVPLWGGGGGVQRQDSMWFRRSFIVLKVRLQSSQVYSCSSVSSAHGGLVFRRPCFR